MSLARTFGGMATFQAARTGKSDLIWALASYEVGSSFKGFKDGFSLLDLIIILRGDP